MCHTLTIRRLFLAFAHHFIFANHLHVDFYRAYLPSAIDCSLAVTSNACSCDPHLVILTLGFSTCASIFTLTFIPILRTHLFCFSLLIFTFAPFTSTHFTTQYQRRVRQYEPSTISTSQQPSMTPSDEEPRRRSGRVSRAPGRYRESPDIELPPNPIFALPTIQYNPNLPPAAFPTVPLGTLPPSAIKTLPSLETPAQIFRDPRIRGFSTEWERQNMIGKRSEMNEGPWNEYLGENGEPIGERIFPSVSIQSFSFLYLITDIGYQRP
jgi:hypothetical protein